MTEGLITRLAETHRLKVRRAEDGEPIIPGRYGHLYSHTSDTMGLCLGAPPGEALTPRKWNNRRRRCMGAGMELHQDGDTEGALLFDPADENHVRLAVKLAGVKRRRVLSEAQREVLARARESSPLMRRTPPRPQERREAVGAVGDTP